MKDFALYKKAVIKDSGFPAQVNRHISDEAGLLFFNHWHEQLEILYFVSGACIIECNSQVYKVDQGDILLVNSNELHSGHSTGGRLVYYCLDIDTSLLGSGLILLFNNKISSDNEILECMENIIHEYDEKGIGCDLLIKSNVYRLLALLIKKQVKRSMTNEEYSSKLNALERLQAVFNYIEENYNEKIPHSKLFEIAGLSGSYFCRLFRKITGRTPNEYINTLRISKAEYLLRNTGMSVTEAALETGFNDINYFSRQFKKYRKVPPSTLRK